MMVAVTLAVLMLGNSVAAPARDLVRDPATVEFHVRTPDALVRAWLNAGAAESQTLRDLLAQLTASDIIVHLVLVDRIAGGVSGQLYFVTATPTARYLRAEIVRGNGRAEMIALIAHELQHAAEIAGAPRVRDSRSMSAFYLGMRENAGEWHRYDSSAARTTESLVRREVISHHPTADENLELAAQLTHASHLAR